MLEEALRNEKSNPSEVALAMLSFLQNELPAGGTAADSRFFELFGPLCERIFGRMLGPQDGFRHKEGGWLSAPSPWPRPISVAPPSPSHRVVVGATRQHGGGGGSSGVGSSSSRTSPSALDAEPVVKLLGSAGNPKISKDPLLPTLIESISKESESRPSVGFALRIDALPKPIQDAWFALVEASMGGKPADCASENDLRLLATLLRKRPEEQNQLKLFRQRSAAQKQAQQDPLRQPLHLSPRGFNVPTPMQISPSSRNAAQSPYSYSSSPTKKPVAEEVPPNAMLSMLEYYLFLYLRFPLAAPDRNRTPAVSPAGVNVHRVSVRAGSRTTSGTQREYYGDMLYFVIFRKCMRHFLPYEREDDRWIDFLSQHSEYYLRESELFLRIVIALWLESRVRLIPTPKILQTIQQHQQLMGLDTSAAAANLDLNASYDLVQQVPTLKYESPPAQVSKCVRSLIVHTVLDPAVRRAVLDRDVMSAQSWCLTSCMTALQQPVYNHVRATFRYASIHTSDSPFFGALNAWLIWLEPWNVTETPKVHFSAKNAKQRIMSTVSGNEPTKAVSRVLTLPRYNHASKYNADWEPYIAANVFMYAVPLAIFLRRARELDFSAGRFDKSIEIVKRVFRVFTPEVVDAVSRHLGDSSVHPPRYSHLVKRHTEVLAEFGPPPGPMTLNSLKSDMQSLLEEIDMQHRKKVRELDTFDWLLGKVEGLFGKGVVSGEEKKLESLVERAKLIARLPIDYEILPQTNLSSSTSSRGDADQRAPLRVADGGLSSPGREEVVVGTVKCNPAEISYYGDKMRSRARSHELPLLVNLTIWASDALNKKFGLSGEQGSFRFNLRFFADYRNALFVAIVTYLFFKIMW